MTTVMNAQQVLNREFLEIRAKILELAASFDRLDRCAATQGEATSLASDPRLARIHEALRVLQHPEGSRAERVQLVFSRAYDENWPETFGISPQKPAAR
jgi:hypothetical protein